MLKYKIDILESLKEKGYTSYKIRKERTKEKKSYIYKLKNLFLIWNRFNQDTCRSFTSFPMKYLSSQPRLYNISSYPCYL